MDGRSSLLAVPAVPGSADSRKSSLRAASSCEKNWRLSLVLPAYNEEAGIRQAVEEACAALAECTRAYEVVVVDDGSCDGTAAVVAELARQRRQVRLLRHDGNRGYGAALRTGFAAARYERVAFTDADCQFHLADLGQLLQLSDRSPVVVGWRQRRQDSWRRCFLSRGYNLLTGVLLGTRVRDCDCALKVFRRDVLPDLWPETNTFFVNAEMLTKARQLGLEVAEVGVRHRPRLHGQSKVSLREVPRIVATLLPFWWSRVLFPTWRAGSHQRPEEHALGALTRPRSPVALAILLLLAVTLFFLRLRAPLLEPQEPRYAEIPRQMLSEGRFIVPVLHGEPYLDKPPLLYWLVMGSYSMFGVHDWAARVVPGLAGVLTVLLTYWWGRRVAGERIGLCGALILCLSAGFVYRQRMLNMDSLLCLWVTAALASGHEALTAGRMLRQRWWLLSAAACGLGFLTKGPVALVLIATPLLFYSFLEPRCVRPSWRDWSRFVLLAAALAAPWYVAVMIQVPDFAYTFFWRHHVERFLTPFDHEKPAWFYLPGLLVGMLPWTLLLPGFVRFLSRRSMRAARRRPAALGFFLLSSLLCLVFFSLSGCKRPAYILPALPPLALALGCYLNLLVPRARQRTDAGVQLLWQWRSRSARSATLLVLTLAVGILALAGFKQLLELSTVLMLASLAVCGFAFLCTRRVSWGVCAAVTFAVLALGVYHLQPAYNRQFALRGQLQSSAVRADEGQLSIACYPQRWDSVSFYLPQAEVRIYNREQRRQLLADLRTRPRTLLLVRSGKHLDELLRALPESMEFVSQGQSGFVTAGWVRPRSESCAEVKRKNVPVASPSPSTRCAAARQPRSNREAPPQEIDSTNIIARFQAAKDGVGHLLLPVVINKKKYLFLLDTGSARMVYDTSLRSILGKPKQTLTVTTPADDVELEGFDSPAAFLGQLSLQTASKAVVSDLSNLRESMGCDFFGIIGMSFLKAHVVQIDFDKGEILFLRSPGCKPGFAFPLTFQQEIPYTEIVIPGWKRKEKAVIDTGSNSSDGNGYIRFDLYKHLTKNHIIQLLSRSGQSDVLEGSMWVTDFRLKELSHGPITRRNLIFSASRKNHDNILNLGYLSRYVVTFDFPKKTMYLQKGTMFDLPENENCSGLSIHRHAGKTLVRRVAWFSPAWWRGVQFQDVILEIEGTNADQTSLYALRRLLGMGGKEVHLVLQRGQKRIEVSLKPSSNRDKAANSAKDNFAQTP